MTPFNVFLLAIGKYCYFLNYVYKERVFSCLDMWFLQYRYYDGQCMAKQRLSPTWGKFQYTIFQKARENGLYENMYAY